MGYRLGRERRGTGFASVPLGSQEKSLATICLDTTLGRDEAEGGLAWVESNKKARGFWAFGPGVV